MPAESTQARPTISVIIPTLDEAPVIDATLARLNVAGVLEVIVADGGSRDATVARAQAHGARVVVGSRGRARQMNAADRQASGEILLFLHADTLVPDGFAAAIAAACAAPQVIGGRFDVVLAPATPLIWLTGALMNQRSRLTKIATGDQGIFVRRAIFDRLGGYADIPLMEDIDFSRRMKRCGAIACLRARVTTSARRWQEWGALRTILWMWSLRLLYFLGVSPQRLARRYRDVR
jgi:rSAM/selenodomain-associated transferase 2